MDPKNQPLQVDIDDATARGTYTNLALITHSETEFLLDFLFIQPQTPKSKVLTRIVTSPIHAKRLLWALKENIDKYESRFGVIAAGENPAQPKGVPGVIQ
ncbi:MAG: DUF3467 domain-containing protein [Elusimicrobia bacterium]|nr:DUF3467 domain-containing protein [Elusimicrobiota bacterium]